MFYKKGFTLAEVLITLGIIGVIAAMILPGLVNNYTAHKLRTQFFKSYSLINQALQTMVAKEDYVTNVSFNSATFYKKFAQNLKVLEDCGNYYGDKNNTHPCYVPNTGTYKYKNLAGGVAGNGFENKMDDGTLLLMDGTTLYFENDAARQNYVIFITVDLNGVNGEPNMLGYDVFTFQLEAGELKPMGAEGTKYRSSDKTTGGGLNGIGCAYLAVHDPNYFKNIVKLVK